jgi:TM2 domain-containing membrane protein YozV
MYDPVSPVGAQQSIPVLGPTKTADSTESKHECSPFARQLLNEKKWTLAMLEFERTLHLSGDPCCRIEAAEGLFECSYHIDEFAPFLDNFYRVLDTLRDDTIGKTRCGVLLAKRYILSGDYTGAIAALRRYACTGDERYVLISFCFLSLRDPKQAGRFADSISAGSPFRKFTDSVRLRSAAIVVPAYSPGIAGVLSAIIPGAGYLYINRPQTAIASFFINGLFVWSTVDFISARQYGAGATSLLLGSGFYFGNIRGSVVAARNENDKTRKLKIGILLEHSGYFW